MTQIKLLNMKIRNFKGVTNYELNADGQDINVQGDNGTGKTTLYDAFLWCLFGKNSADQATFDWKPLDEQGNEIHHLETEVVAELEVNGKARKLSRMTSEDWVKKRGSATETFDGHTTSYKIDDLSVKKKEFDESLSKLIDEDLFKLLTNVHHFPEKMKWQDRRQTLIDMVGDITDLDVIEKNKELEPLKGLIEERPASELKQLTEQKMKQINKDIKSLPNRIDEVDRSLPDIESLDREQLEADKKLAEDVINNLQDKRATLKNSDGVVELKNKVANLRLDYRALATDHEESLNKELAEVRERANQLEADIRDLKSKEWELKQASDTFERDISSAKEEIEGLERRKKDLLDKFYEVREREVETFEEHQTSCPTCGQELPSDEILKLKSDHEEEVKAINENKANDLKEINAVGKEVAANIEKQGRYVAISEKELITTKESLLEVSKEIEEFQEKARKDNEYIRSIKSQNPFEETDKAKEIISEAEKLEEQIKSGQTNIEDDLNKIQSDIDAEQAKIDEVNNSLSLFALHARQSQRKEELINEEQELSIEYGQLEQRLYLLEEFTRTKVNLLTETINNKFKEVKFKLFEEQINGGLKEICEVTMNGANYSTGLNNAARINAGLDIVNTLMDHHDVYVPVFIDNAESVNELFDVDAQLITLSVTNHKNLRVEVA